MPLRDTILLRPRGCRSLRRCEGNWKKLSPPISIEDSHLADRWKRGRRSDAPLSPNRAACLPRFLHLCLAQTAIDAA